MLVWYDARASMSDFLRDVNKKNKKSLQIKRVIYITRNGIDLMQNKKFPDNEK